MSTFIVAVEYRGQVVSIEGSARVPTCQHAYDVDTATLVGHHPGQRPRVAFPAQQRAWNADPITARCPHCDSAVEQLVRELITDVLSAITHPPMLPPPWRHCPPHRKTPP